MASIDYSGIRDDLNSIRRLFQNFEERINRYLDSRQNSNHPCSQQLADTPADSDVAACLEDIHDTAGITESENDSVLVKEHYHKTDAPEVPTTLLENPIERDSKEVADSKLDLKLVDDISRRVLDSEVPPAKFFIGNSLTPVQFATAEVSNGCIQASDTPLKIKYEEENAKNNVTKVFAKFPHLEEPGYVSAQELRIVPLNNGKELHVETHGVPYYMSSYMMQTNGLYMCRVMHPNGVPYFPFDPGLYMLTTTSRKYITPETILAMSLGFLNSQTKITIIRNLGGSFHVARISDYHDSSHTFLQATDKYAFTHFHWPINASVVGQIIFKIKKNIESANGHTNDFKADLKDTLLNNTIPRIHPFSEVMADLEVGNERTCSSDKATAITKLQMSIRLSKNGAQLVSKMEMEKLWDTPKHKMCSILGDGHTDQVVDGDVVNPPFISFKIWPSESGAQGISLLLKNKVISGNNLTHGLYKADILNEAFHVKEEQGAFYCLKSCIIMSSMLINCLRDHEKLDEGDCALKRMSYNVHLFRIKSGSSEAIDISLANYFKKDSYDKIRVFDPGGSTLVVLILEDRSVNFRAILTAILMLSPHNAHLNLLNTSNFNIESNYL